MTSSQEKHQQQIIIRLLTQEADWNTLDELRVHCDSRMQPRWSIHTRANSTTEATLGGFLPSGEMVASLLLRVASTDEELKDHFGFSVPNMEFPVLTTTLACALPGNSPYLETMRFFVLSIARRVLSGGKPITAHASVNSLGSLSLSARADLERLGYEILKVSSVISPVAVTVLPASKFIQAQRLLGEDILHKVLSGMTYEGGKQPLESLYETAARH